MADDRMEIDPGEGTSQPAAVLRTCASCSNIMIGYDTHDICIPCGRSCDGLRMCTKCGPWSSEVWSLDFKVREQVKKSGKRKSKKRNVETVSVSSIPTDAESEFLADEPRPKRPKKTEDLVASLREEIAQLKQQRGPAGSPKVSAKPAVAETKTYTTRVKEAVMSKLTATGVVVNEPDAVSEAAAVVSNATYDGDSPDEEKVDPDYKIRSAAIRKGAVMVKRIFDLPAPPMADAPGLYLNLSMGPEKDKFASSPALPWSPLMTRGATVAQRVVEGGKWLPGPVEKVTTANKDDFLGQTRDYWSRRYPKVMPPDGELLAPPGSDPWTHERPLAVKPPKLESIAREMVSEGATTKHPLAKPQTFIPYSLRQPTLCRLETNIWDTALALSHRDYFMMAIQVQLRQFLSGDIDRAEFENSSKTLFNAVNVVDSDIMQANLRQRLTMIHARRTAFWSSMVKHYNQSEIKQELATIDARGKKLFDGQLDAINDKLDKHITARVMNQNVVDGRNAPHQPRPRSEYQTTQNFKKKFQGKKQQGGGRGKQRKHDKKPTAEKPGDSKQKPS